MGCVSIAKYCYTHINNNFINNNNKITYLAIACDIIVLKQSYTIKRFYYMYKT